MAYECKTLLDSISETNKRITTFQITFPRCVLAEAETHRVLRGWGGNIEEFIVKDLGINVDENLSRNSASSRAIPISKMIKRVQEDPFIPEKWGKPVAGMGAKEYWPLDSNEHRILTQNWNLAKNKMLEFVTEWQNIGNKEDLNRLLEPFMWHTAIITATEWDNFFKLRTNEAADWKIKKIADLMYEAYNAFDKYGEVEPDSNKISCGEWTVVRPQKLKINEWHCPLVSEKDEELIIEYGRNNNYILKPALYQTDIDFIQRIKKEISVARCARVSYLTHDGKRDIEKDLELFERLKTSGHWSPFEHVARPSFAPSFNLNDEGEHDMMDCTSGNFVGWRQYRKEFQDENCTNFKKG